MSLDIQILGRPGYDNATLVTVDTGNAIHRLLFDCGAGCLDSLSTSDIQSIDHVFFSHYHMDHICGFDDFFRANYNRPDRPVILWGPPGTIDIMHHRMRGYTWNLHHGQRGEWIVNEIGLDGSSGSVQSAGFYTKEAFAKKHLKQPRLQLSDDYHIDWQMLDHGSIPSVAYRLRETDRENIDPQALHEIGIRPGPWLRELKETLEDDDTIELEGTAYRAGDLRQRLMTTKPGESMAYLTDFILEPGSTAWQHTADWLQQTDTLVCESQYLETDVDLAKANSHMTAKRVGQLAAEAQVGKLLLQHVSRRYSKEDWQLLLKEAQAEHSETAFPSHWRLYPIE